jgi:hypothetical protein
MENHGSYVEERAKKRRIMVLSRRRRSRNGTPSFFPEGKDYGAETMVLTWRKGSRNGKPWFLPGGRDQGAENYGSFLAEGIKE